MRRWTLSIIFRPDMSADLLVLADVMSPANGLAVGEMTASRIRLYKSAHATAADGALPFIDDLLDGKTAIELPNGTRTGCAIHDLAAGLKHIMGPDEKPFVGLTRMSENGISVLEQAPAGGITPAGLAAAFGNPQPGTPAAALAQMQSAAKSSNANVVPLRPGQPMMPRALPTATPAPAVPFPRTSTYYAPQNVYFPDRPLSESYALMTGAQLANGELQLLLVPLTGSGVPAIEIGSFDAARNLIKAAQWNSHPPVAGGISVAPLPADMLAPGNPRKYPRPLDSHGKPCVDGRNQGGRTFYNIVGCALCEAYGWEMDTKGDDDCQDYPLTKALGTPVFSLAWQDQASYEAGIAAFQSQAPAMEAAMMKETLGIVSSIAGGPVNIQFVDQNGNVTASYGNQAQGASMPASQPGTVAPLQAPQPVSTARPAPQVTTLGTTVPAFDQNALGLLIQPDGSVRPPATIAATLALGLVKHPRHPALEAIVLAAAGGANLPTIQIGDWDPSTKSGVLDFTAASIAAGTALSPLPLGQLRIIHQGPISSFDEIAYHVTDSLGQAIGCTVDELRHDANASATLKTPAFALVCKDAAGVQQSQGGAPAVNTGGGSTRPADEPLPPLPDAMKDLASAVKANPGLLRKLDPKLAATLKAHTGFDDREEKLKKIDDGGFKPILGGGWS